jgi:EAL domain-containing protein (putative c-di-GMP-specific phosphodiesterase class I)
MKIPELLASVRLLYQPIVRLSDGAITSVEVLSRLIGQDGQISGPADLLRAMTDATSAIDLSLALMRQGLAEHAASGLAARNLPLAFNLKLDALLHPALLRHVLDLCAEFSVPPRLLRLELTEDQPVSDLNSARQIISRLHEAGFALLLDDITPGLAHLEHLMDMPISAIKLDKSLLTGNADFLAHIIPRARALGQDVIAEGIETAAQAEQMRASGATHGQGFFYAHPLNATALTAYLPG